MPSVKIDLEMTPGPTGNLAPVTDRSKTALYFSYQEDELSFPERKPLNRHQLSALCATSHEESVALKNALEDLQPLIEKIEVLEREIALETPPVSAEMHPLQNEKHLLALREYLSAHQYFHRTLDYYHRQIQPKIKKQIKTILEIIETYFTETSPYSYLQFSNPKYSIYNTFVLMLDIVNLNATFRGSNGQDAFLRTLEQRDPETGAHFQNLLLEINLQDFGKRLKEKEKEQMEFFNDLKSLLILIYENRNDVLWMQKSIWEHKRGIQSLLQAAETLKMASTKYRDLKKSMGQSFFTDEDELAALQIAGPRAGFTQNSSPSKIPNLESPTKAMFALQSPIVNGTSPLSPRCSIFSEVQTPSPPSIPTEKAKSEEVGSFVSQSSLWSPNTKAAEFRPSSTASKSVFMAKVPAGTKRFVVDEESDKLEAKYSEPMYLKPFCC